MNLHDFLKESCGVETIAYDDFILWGDVTAKGWHKERKDYGRGMLLYHLVSKMAPRNILEIGTGRGYSTICMLKAMQSLTPRVHKYAITTIDKTYYKTQWAMPNGVTTSVKKLMSSVIGNTRAIKFLTGESEDVLPTLHTKFDFIFVDGSHKSDRVMFDCEQSLRLLSSEGTLVFHDYMCPSTPGVFQGVAQCMDRLVARFDLFEVCTRGDFIEGEYIVAGEMGSLVCLPKKLPQGAEAV